MYIRNMKLSKKTLFILWLKLFVVNGWSSSRTKVALTVWNQRCDQHDLAVNDCNWCRCESNLQYACTARVCTNVDMFGHFNDAIREVDVGMEGKGVWRTQDNACDPGVHYKKGETLCVCSEDGKWPSPVCRDMFQVLHTVVKTKFQTAENQLCTPNTLYQVGCNVCYCTEEGRLNSSYCTKRDCSDDIDISATQKKTENEVVDEVYATCDQEQHYKIGCKTCICLRNNRLLCNNCTSTDDPTSPIQDIQNNSICTGKEPGERFNIDCNTCYCDQKDVIYCTVFNCLQPDRTTTLPEIDYEIVDAPFDNHECVPGTKYSRSCNTCHCFVANGVKYFGCTLNKCGNSTSVSNDAFECVDGTKYEKNCLICECLDLRGEKTELCSINPKCGEIENKNKEDLGTSLEGLKSLDSMHGYCEPLHAYYKDCNKCRCMPDGKTASCTSKICKENGTLKPIPVEFVPFIQKQASCLKGQKYMVDCNLCVCLSNGNTLCTTSDCNKNVIK